MVMSFQVFVRGAMGEQDKKYFIILEGGEASETAMGKVGGRMRQSWENEKIRGKEDGGSEARPMRGESTPHRRETTRTKRNETKE